MHNRNASTDVMEATEHERLRLALQGSILNPLTENFLRQAGLSSGMHVLDLGCGIGDVSLIAARLVGPAGSVTGLDPDGAALDIARTRANEEHLPQATFEQTSFEAYTAGQSYDAVVGRHILIHSAEPFEWIQKVKTLLRSGGIAAFEEYDLSYFPPIEPELPLFSELGDYLVELFRRACALPAAGARLDHWMQLAGFPTFRQVASALLLAARNRLFTSGSRKPFEVSPQRWKRSALRASRSWTWKLLPLAFARGYRMLRIPDHPFDRKLLRRMNVNVKSPELSPRL
jgi:SAM-dependent methyltransferase